MSTPVIPSIIRGPAVLIYNSYTYYTQGDIRVNTRRNVQPTQSDMFGNLGDTHESQVTEISFTPVGEVESMVKYFPYGPSNLTAASSVGNSIFTGSDVPLVIHTKAGQTITYHRAGISVMPPLNLSPRSTLFNEMTFVALGKRATQQTDAAFWKTIGSSAFSDTSFDHTKVVKDIYTATLGARLSPYDAIGARNGFLLTPILELEEVQDDNVGIADMIISSVGMRCTFAPNNLTEAQVDTLINHQDSDAILPGQFIGRGPSGTPEDLVIDSDVFTATLHAAGVTSGENGYGVRVDRNGNLEWTYRQTFTSGAPDPIFSLVVN